MNQAPAAADPVARLAEARWWAVATVSGIAGYVASSHGLFSFGAIWQASVFVGCVVGLLSTRPVATAAIAGSVMVVGSAVLPPALPAGARLGPSTYVSALTLATLTALAIAFVRRTGSAPLLRFVDLGLPVVMVVWVVLSLWAPLAGGGLPPSGYGALRASTIRDIPQPGVYVMDDAIYRRVFYLMHRGEPYHTAFRDAWTGLAQKPALPNTVTGYRLPTLFWLWRLAPPDAFWIVYIFLALCTVGVVSGGLIAGQLAGARFAPLAAVALAAYAMAVGLDVYVTYVDLPAMSIALAGVALFVHSCLHDDRRTLWAAAVALAAAALTREILAYLIAIAALSAFAQRPGARLRATVPWLSALALFAVGYAAHAVAVWPYVSFGSGQLSYLKGGASFVIDGLTRFGFIFNGWGASLAAFFAFGVLGAYASHRAAGRQFAAFAVAALVLPQLVMLRLGNPGIELSGRQVNYWGMLVVPLALALWPAWVLLLRHGEEL